MHGEKRDTGNYKRATSLTVFERQIKRPQVKKELHFKIFHRFAVFKRHVATLEELDKFISLKNAQSFPFRVSFAGEVMTLRSTNTNTQ